MGKASHGNIAKIRKEAKKVIYACKERCYGKGTDADNVMEGDYGSWKAWQDVLVKFGIQMFEEGFTKGWIEGGNSDIQ